MQYCGWQMRHVPVGLFFFRRRRARVGVTRLVFGVATLLLAPSRPRSTLARSSPKSPHRSAAILARSPSVPSPRLGRPTPPRWRCQCACLRSPCKSRTSVRDVSNCVLWHRSGLVLQGSRHPEGVLARWQDRLLQPSAPESSELEAIQLAMSCAA